MSYEFTVVLSGLAYLECPRWHDGRIWVSDFYRHEVLSATEQGDDLRVEATVPGQPSGLGWLPDGRLLIVSMRDRLLLRREFDGSLVVHADLSAHLDHHANDMVVDAEGRAYVGSFGFDLMAGADVAPGVLLRIDPDGSVHRAAEDLWFANGSVITEDGRLLVDETFGNRVSAFDIGPDGSLFNRHDWARFGDPPSERGLAAALAALHLAPDGCACDADGMLWIADALHGRAVRVREGGEIVDEVSPGTGVFACGLGGTDGRTLFLCTAPDFDEQARAAAREARLLSVRVPVPHAGRP